MRGEQRGMIVAAGGWDTRKPASGWGKWENLEAIWKAMLEAAMGRACVVHALCSLTPKGVCHTIPDWQAISFVLAEQQEPASITPSASRWPAMTLRVFSLRA